MRHNSASEIHDDKGWVVWIQTSISGTVILLEFCLIRAAFKWKTLKAFCIIQVNGNPHFQWQWKCSNMPQLPKHRLPEKSPHVHVPYSYSWGLLGTEEWHGHICIVEVRSNCIHELLHPHRRFQRTAPVQKHVNKNIDYIISQNRVYY